MSKNLSIILIGAGAAGVFFTGYLFIIFSFILLLFLPSSSLELGNGELNYSQKKAVFNNQIIDVPLAQQ